MENITKTKYKIFGGLGGSFGGADFCGVEEHETEDAALASARQHALEEYESYGGLHGLVTREEIEEQLEEQLEDGGDEFTQNDIDVLYEEEYDGWLDFHVEECTGDCFNCDEEETCDQQDEYGNECEPIPGDCDDCDCRSSCRWFNKLNPEDDPHCIS